MKILRLKKIFVFVLSVFLFFPFELSRTEAITSSTLTKTVEFFIGQESAVKNSGEYTNLSPFTINIPENISAGSIKNAIIEINGISYNDSGDQIITADLERNANLPGAEPTYVVNYFLGGTNNKPRPFSLKYNALLNNLGQEGLGPMSDIAVSNNSYVYKLYLKDTVAAGSVSFSVASAKLILTYESSASSANFSKTNKFFIEQKTNSVSALEIVNKDFTLTIPEQSPAIQSVFVEISGSAKGSSSGNFQTGIVPQGTGETYSNLYSLDLGATSANSKFLIRHDASSEISFIESGSKNYALYFKSDIFNIDLWSAKLIVTYKYSESAGGLQPKGEIISSVIDTGIVKGAAFNSIMWKGSLPGGKVQFQFASSDSSNGPWTFEGPGCTTLANDVYWPAAQDTPAEIMCAQDHNNKRYFRYKMIICSNDCTSGGPSTPEVTDVIVNWSP